MSQPTFTLSEISKWAIDDKFDLPNVQRGFVWKPSQIEDLWDSILRGYPIGCFVLSKSAKVDEEAYQILDGQQRATSIALGFAEKTFRGTDHNVKLFIDLDFSKSEKEERKYLFRVITKSHPWGYEKRDNSAALDAEKIRKALIDYNVKNHLETSLDIFYPYDAMFPVPFSFLLHSKSVNSTIQEIKNWPLFEKVKSHYLKQNTDFNPIEFDRFLENRVEKIFPSIYEMINEYPAVPALYLPLNKFISEENEELEHTVQNNEDSNDSNKNYEFDDLENLFVRLNNSGTPLRGEELNYSILKANISLNLQNKIEKACEHFMRPSRFIAILFRVFSNESENKNIGNISLKIKAKVFQKAISEDKSKFEFYIESVLSDKKYDNKTLLEFAKYILAYHPDENRIGFPYIVYSRIAERSPEIMLALLFRLKVKSDRFEVNTPLHRKMLGVISLFYWAGKGERIRDHSKLLRNIWPSVSQVKNCEGFWSSSTISRARIDDVMSYFPKFHGTNGLKVFLKKRTVNTRSNKDPLILRDKEDILLSFINSTLFNRDIVAYSQRDFLYHQFLPVHYTLDDTNVPFDWDHISPQKAIAINNKSEPISSVYRTIGNFRAWPFSLNRMDQANTPFHKFNPFYENNSENIADLLREFEIRLKKPINNLLELKKALLELSICDKEWEECNSDKLRNRDEWKQVYDLIMKRNLILYQNWYSELLLDDLFPLSSPVSFESVFYANKWNKNPKINKNINEYFEYNEYDNWLSNTIIPNTKIFFSYKRGKALENEGFIFGVLEISAERTMLDITIPEKDKNKYHDFNEKEISIIQGNFTLISTEKSSYQILLSEIYNWVRYFPNKILKKAIIDYFDNNLKKENKDYFASHNN